MVRHHADPALQAAALSHRLLLLEDAERPPADLRPVLDRVRYGTPTPGRGDSLHLLFGTEALYLASARGLPGWAGIWRKRRVELIRGLEAVQRDDGCWEPPLGETGRPSRIRATALTLRALSITTRDDRFFRSR
jgi:hypothetical protein